MNILMGLPMFPLQANITNFEMPAANTGDTLYFVIGIAIIAIILIILNAVKGKFNTKGGGPGGKHAVSNAPRNYSSFTLHRLTSNFGFNRDQVHMLDYVLRSGAVTDPERFLNSHDLIDRHFKRAYRLIERTSSGDEQLNERLAVLFSVRNILDAHAGGTKVASSTQQIPDKTAGVLTVGKVNYPVQIVSSKGDVLLVENAKKGSSGLFQIAKGSKANLAFFTKSSKGFVVETRVLGTSTSSSGTFLQLAHSGQIKKLSNRRFRRRQTLIETNFYLVNVEGSGKNKKMTVDKRKRGGNILDISVGGCSLKTGAPVNQGQRIKIEFTRDDNSIIAALGEVLRISKSGVSTVMHIKFVKVPRRSLNSINAMVYEYTEK